MTAYCCGKWDGCNLFASWDARPGQISRVQWRSRPSEEADWGPWKRVIDSLTIPWLKLPLWREGHQAQLAVAVDAGAFEIAREVTFLTPRCRFLVSSNYLDLFVEKGTEYIATVDGAPCSYRVEEDFEVMTGGEVAVDMVAVSPTAWNQLDAPDDFLLRPSFGVTVKNKEPSRGDFEETGRDFTVMQAVQRGENNPLRISFSKPIVR